MKPNSFHLSESLLDGVYEWMRSAELKQTGKRPIPADDTSISTNGARPIIKRELLGKLITEAFWASYMKEEDRNITFSVVVKGPTSDDCGGFEFIDEHIKFDSASLVKLCPALDSSRHLIGVTECQKHRDLVIWGFEPRLQPKSWSLFGAMRRLDWYLTHQSQVVCLSDTMGPHFALLRVKKLSLLTLLL